ncbi:MAG: hypothetical protein OJF52_000063 [Nitrospira sp.]|nr:MAG: hypothetical protein OJF52_000063 [Nitrospira sp.]
MGADKTGSLVDVRRVSLALSLRGRLVVLTSFLAACSPLHDA